jgi:hypothetical protein
VVLDGSAYFNRPGPRLVDSLEVLVGARATSPQHSSQRRRFAGGSMSGPRRTR